MLDPTVEERTESWFVRQGLPHFIHHYSATTDVLTRAAPLLTLVFLFELTGALNLEWVWWANVLAAVGGLAVLLGGWSVANRARGRRPLAPPDDVEAPEILTFVFLPALLPLVFGGQVGSAVATAVGNAAVLGLIVLGTSYGVVPLTRWALGQLRTQVATVVNLVAGALPVLLLFTTFLFVNAEMWQVGSDLDGAGLAAVVSMFFVAGTVFLITRIPREVQGLVRPDDGDFVDRLVEGTPVAELIHPGDPAPPAPPLSRREWANVGLVVLFAKGVQVLLVGLVVAMFFTGFGVVAVTAPTVEAWTGVAPDALATFTLSGRELVLSSELLVVSTFLGSFSAFYFAVYLVTDDVFRREFLDDVLEDLQRSLAVRAVYLDAVAGTPVPGPVP